MEVREERLPNASPVYQRSLYGYIPTKWICILFVVLFGISTVIHLYQAVAPRSRTYFMLLTAFVAGVLEVIGWIGRTLSADSPLSLDAYLMQICCTILAPTPLLASNFVILGRIITKLGTGYSRIPPMWYTIIFCTFDLVALVVQAVGGGRASVAVKIGRSPEPGGNVMLGGIVLQLAAIVVFAGLAAEFLFRYQYDKPLRPHSPNSELSRHSTVTSRDETPVPIRGVLEKRTKLMLYAVAFSTLCLFIRAVYRTIELVDGWTGRIIRTQVYFNVLDGAMIVLAIFSFNIFHPGYLVYHEKTTNVENDKEKA